MENLTGGTPPVRYLPCVVPCKLYFNSGETGPRADRAYRDRLFRMIFKDKREFLELYNALNGTSYDRPEDLTAETLENAVYLGMKNDLAFLVYAHLSLYEHQSTRNPNMPLRNLFYVSGIYSRLTRDSNLYGEKLIKIPKPQFVVFYNGTDPMPESSVIRLSEAFDSEEENGEPDLELKVRILNINPGNNRKLMEQCRTLWEYAQYVTNVREYAQYVTNVRKYAESLELDASVECAIRECIGQGILKELLLRNRSEVKTVSIFEYNEERHMKQEREENYRYGKEDGRREGLDEGRREGLEKGIAIGKTAGRAEGAQAYIRLCMEFGLKKNAAAARLMEHFGMTEEEAEEFAAGAYGAGPGGPSRS